MSEAPGGPRTKGEKAAAERLLNAEAALAESSLEINKLKLKSEKLYLQDVTQTHAIAGKKFNEYMVSDNERHTFRFLGSVNPASCKSAIDALVRWHRLDPGCDITLVIDSPGGDIISGFHLFDTIVWLKAEGHKITTIATGMAASMGGVLFQAGTYRIMTPQASMLIHEAQFGVGGSTGQVEDEVKYVKMLQDRILKILAERSTLSKAQIKRRWSRTNWWLMSEEALELGFADSIE